VKSDSSSGLRNPNRKTPDFPILSGNTKQGTIDPWHSPRGAWSYWSRVFHYQGLTNPLIDSSAGKDGVQSLLEGTLTEKRLRYRFYDWDSLPVVAQLDLIATEILALDRRAIDMEFGQHDQPFTGIMSVWQYSSRRKHEVLMAQLPAWVLATGRPREWRWFDGYWYGDARRLMQGRKSESQQEDG
jgi:hypothetical protein